MGAFDWIFDKVGRFTALHLMDMTSNQREYVMGVDKRRNYARGEQENQIAIQNGQDDNVFMNVCGLAINRSVDMVLSGGVEVKIENKQKQKYLDELLDYNRKEILLQNAATLAAQAGHGFIKIVTNGGEVTEIPRLIALDPMTVNVVTAEQDVGTALEYQIAYPVEDKKKNKVVARRQRIYFEDEHLEEMQNGETSIAPERWILQWQEKGNNDRWVNISEPDVWPYSFPPIFDWQNLPNPVDYHGQPDLTDDMIRLQNKMNFVSSNIAKTIKLFANPVVWIRGVQFDEKYKKMPILPGMIYPLGNEGEMGLLEMQSDLISSVNYYNELKATFFAISRTVNMADQNLGNFTDYQLSVLYRDAIAKTNMKRLLLKEALEDLFEAVLELRFGQSDEKVKVEFGDILPENPDEKIERKMKELGMGIVSKETISKDMGYSWEDEQGRIDGERMSEDTAGARLVQSFLAQQI